MPVPLDPATTAREVVIHMLFRIGASAFCLPDFHVPWETCGPPHVGLNIKACFRLASATSLFRPRIPSCPARLLVHN
jgi:hypothetical protein